MHGSGPNGAWFATDDAFWARVTQPIVAWKIWYAHGSQRDSTTCTWANAPKVGVQVLMVYHPGGRRTIVKGRDEYTLPGESESKLGLMIDREEFEQMQLDAIADSWRP